MNSCPRCQKQEIRVEHQGRKQNRIIWNVLYCHSCSFTWRDTEPETTVVFEKRDPFFRVNTDKPHKYPIVLPPTDI